MGGHITFNHNFPYYEHAVKWAIDEWNNLNRNCQVICFVDFAEVLLASTEQSEFFILYYVPWVTQFLVASFVYLSNSHQFACFQVDVNYMFGEKGIHLVPYPAQYAIPLFPEDIKMNCLNDLRKRYKQVGANLILWSFTFHIVIFIHFLNAICSLWKFCHLSNCFLCFVLIRSTTVAVIIHV